MTYLKYWQQFQICKVLFMVRNLIEKIKVTYCVKSVRIPSYSRPYSVPLGENTDQNNSE